MLPTSGTKRSSNFLTFNGSDLDLFGRLIVPIWISSTTRSYIMNTGSLSRLSMLPASSIPTLPTIPPGPLLLHHNHISFLSAIHREQMLDPVIRQDHAHGYPYGRDPSSPVPCSLPQLIPSIVANPRLYNDHHISEREQRKRPLSLPELASQQPSPLPAAASSDGLWTYKLRSLDGSHVAGPSGMFSSTTVRGG